MNVGENKSSDLTHMGTKNADDILENIDMESINDNPLQNNIDCVISDKNSDINARNSEHSNNNCQVVKFSELKIQETVDGEKLSDNEEDVSNSCDLIEHLKALQDVEELSRKIQKLEEKCQKLEQNKLDLEIKLETVLKSKSVFV